ncbi:hypothetical protein GA0074692_6415 [Micromonospora pallida]|uniref:Uncharacterized protein n=1 Tax=Micromonospora pallida TaxID=145854 RepID=A0A1C6TIY7_9ACTN|nr:hypothetical protein [Micromonospora pallida]SCL41627.1 hypothetical protein GA0074692_6415 [Micromonospora pallida]
MSDPDDKPKRPTALGQPTEEVDTTPDPDFATEHDRTAVDRDIITGEDEEDREPESPTGWSGMQR